MNVKREAWGWAGLVGIIGLIITAIWLVADVAWFKGRNPYASAMLDSTAMPENVQVRITSRNLYHELFSEPFETMVMFFPDGSLISITSQNPNEISMPASLIVETVEKYGLTMGDCARIVHNHLTPTRISPTDLKTLAYFRSLGFKGQFIVYYPTSGNFSIASK